MSNSFCSADDLGRFNTNPKMNVVTTYLNTEKTTLLARPAYTSAIQGVSFTIRPRGTDITVNLVSLGDRIEQVVAGTTPRYSVPNITSIGNVSYVNVGDKGTLSSLSKLDPIYKDLSATTIPGTTKKLINTNLKPIGATVSTAKESISYDLIYSLKYEFCFYTKILTTLMKDYIAVQNAGLQNDPKTIIIANIVNNMAIARLRLNDLIEVSNFIATTQNTTMSGLNEDINSFITTTTASVNALDRNAATMMSKDKEYSLRTRQLAFSEEKNAYANQLLAMYGFANLIALGLLFYIYKS
jgi:hypothetical protein